MILQRLYLPISRADVERLRTAGELRAGRTAYGVSPALSAATPRADEEEREYAAFLEAAEAPKRAMQVPMEVAVAAAAAGDDKRTAVLAIDVPDGEVSWPPAGTATTIGRAILRREAVSFHIGAAPGPDADLLWYDVTEAELVEDLLR